MTCDVHPDSSSRVNAGGVDACYWCWIDADIRSRVDKLFVAASKSWYPRPSKWDRNGTLVRR